MAHDSPDLPEMVRTVRDFLVGLTPALEGQDHYHAMCAQYLLDIVLRELDEWAPRRTADDVRIAGILGDDEPRSQAAAVATLAARIRAGELDSHFDALLPVLIRHVTAKVRVSKPSYLESADDAG